MQEVHVHAGTEEVLCPLDLDQMKILLDGRNETFRKSMLGHTSIIMTYFGSVGYFLLAMAMRFVIIKQVLIVFIVVLMNKKKKTTHLGWVVLGVCGVLWFRCSHRGRGTSQGCS